MLRNCALLCSPVQCKYQLRDAIFMREFNKLCKVVEDMDPATYREVIVSKSADVVKGLATLVDDPAAAVATFMDIVFCSIASDGKLDEHEFLIVKPVIDAVLGRDSTFEDATKAFSMAGLDKPKEYKEAVDRMVDSIGLFSPELKEDIVIVCLLVCAVDGKVSFKEKRFIKKLID